MAGRRTPQPPARNERLEAELFAGMSTGINFNNYDDIPVEATGHDVPAPIDKVRMRVWPAGNVRGRATLRPMRGRCVCVCSGRRSAGASFSQFLDIQLHDVLALNIKLAKYDRPTPVQKYGLPIVLAGRDLMACAQTGACIRAARAPRGTDGLV